MFAEWFGTPGRADSARTIRGCKGRSPFGNAHRSLSVNDASPQSEYWLDDDVGYPVRRGRPWRANKKGGVTALSVFALLRLWTPARLPLQNVGQGFNGNVWWKVS
jgi:hypothetical protein